jgi:hypothetical protein
MAGPIDDLLQLFGPPWQAADDSRFAEQFLMETFADARNWTRSARDFCGHVDFFLPRTPAGVLFLVKDGLYGPADVTELYPHQLPADNEGMCATITT